MKFRKLVIATQNPNKLCEMRNIFKDYDIEILGIEDDSFNPIEDGMTFKENAHIKARDAAKITGLPALGDDTGLIVEALDGRPGIHSARYAQGDESKIEKLLGEMKNIQQANRSARFLCAMVIVSPDGEELFSTEGICEGSIVTSIAGEHGFGYDPVFYVNEKQATMAQIPLNDKNKVSHRGKALNSVINWLMDE